MRVQLRYIAQHRASMPTQRVGEGHFPLKDVGRGGEAEKTLTSLVTPVGEKMFCLLESAFGI